MLFLVEEVVQINVQEGLVGSKTANALESIQNLVSKICLKDSLLKFLELI